ncbi:Peptidase family M50 [Rosistilla oblonga]|uniref:Peptidase family M50 n=2 Tax=Rosistilla oblonga TaxID=2527990 RepID=A0A518IMA6_9BACT|nr:M50 family metallopeptidase [Rosistilla oblonga]QDV10329.1 Peptidase family M50 [Rosistilla oblonga]QDV54228.1 Peptidase family M50 [Rosistilla oblonga]
MLAEPGRTAYDVNFGLLGFPVRISIGFWIMALVFGYDLVTQLAQLFPGSRGPLLLLWILSVFVSILVHELGHALAMRACGQHASIVLYHFGGLAIPQNTFGAGFSKKNNSKAEKIFITAAGPLAQLMLAGIVIAVAKARGFEILLMPEFLASLPSLAGGQPIDSPGMFGLVNFLVWPSVMWALLNLIPVYPLDGGQIAKEIIELFGGTAYHAIVLSLVCAVLMAAWGVTSGRLFMTLLFVSLAYSNYEMLTGGGPRRRF